MGDSYSTFVYQFIMHINISELRSNDIPSLVEVHRNSLPNDFLPSLGKRFMHKFYTHSLNSDYGKTFVAKNSNDIVVGFIAVSFNPEKFLRSIIVSDIPSFFLLTCFALIKKPIMIIHVWDILFEILLPRNNIPAGEIVYISTAKEYRRQGVAKKLIKYSIGLMREKKISRCKTKTLLSNETVIKMYELMGWSIVDQFNQIGKTYVVLTKNVEECCDTKISS